MGADRFGIATSNGLYILNARNMDFRRVYLQEEEDSIYGYAINSIIDYPKENCYLITTDGFGTFVFNAETMEVEGELSEKLNREIGNPFVMAPIVDQYGKLWFSTTSEALMCIDLNHLQRHTFDFTPAAKGAP